MLYRLIGKVRFFGSRLYGIYVCGGGYRSRMKRYCRCGNAVGVYVTEILVVSDEKPRGIGYGISAVVVQNLTVVDGADRLRSRGRLRKQYRIGLFYRDDYGRISRISRLIYDGRDFIAFNVDLNSLFLKTASI